MLTDADFSEDGKFRYRLYREWDSSLPMACFILFNPSIAGAQARDRTDRKCEGFARRLNCGRYVVVNPYAFVATNPQDLRNAGYPTGGEENDRAIRRAAREATGTWGPIICGWGTLGAGLVRPVEVYSQLRREQFPLTALSVNADGTPSHPLMLPYKCTETLAPFRLAGMSQLDR